MRLFGVLIAVVSGLLLMGALAMDTSVPTATGKRVHNIGLMRGQENAVMLGIGGLVVAALFIALGGKKSGTSDPEKQCPHCAERIKLAAKVCRFCGKDVPAEENSQVVL